MCPPGYYQFANDPTVTHALGHMTVHHIYIYINVGNNTLAVQKLSLVIGLTIIKVLTVNLRTKNKFAKKVQNKNFSTNSFAILLR